MEIDPKTRAFRAARCAAQPVALDVTRRGTTIDIHAENFTYVTSTEILDSTRTVTAGSCASG
jgi:hypothetical protein